MEDVEGIEGNPGRLADPFLQKGRPHQRNRLCLANMIPECLRFSEGLVFEVCRNLRFPLLMFPNQT